MGQLDRAIPRAAGIGFEARLKKQKDAFKRVKEKKYEEAAVLFRQNHEWSLKELGEEHAATVYDKELLGNSLIVIKKDVEACDLLGQALETRRKIEGLNPPSVEYLETQLMLGNGFWAQKNLKKAAEIYEINYELRGYYSRHGQWHLDTLRVGYDLAQCWYQLREIGKAKEMNQEILDDRIRNKDSGVIEPQIRSSRQALACCHIELGELQAAEGLYLENIKELKAKTARDAQPKDLAANEQALRECQWRLKAKKSNLPSLTSTQYLYPKHEEKLEPVALSAKDAPKPRPKPVENMPQAEPKSKPPPKQAKENRKPGEGEQDKQNGHATSKPIPILKINAPSENKASNQERPFSRSVPYSKRLSLDLGNKDNQGIPRRVKSQHGRPEREFDFRRLQSSEALSQLDAESDKEHRGHHFGPLPGSMPGSWRINPADLHLPGSPTWAKNPTLQPPEHPSLVRETRDKPPDGLRSPSQAPSVSDKKRVGQLLFDAQEGKYDEDTVKPVDRWFKLLETETQQLLEQKRRNHSKRIKIAILDTGVDLKHPDFAEDQAKPFSERRIKKPLDFLDSKGNGRDICGHGTHCVGLLRRVAPWADIHVARVATDFNGDLDPMIIAKAIRKACMDGVDPDGKRNWNVDILTMSFGFYGRSKAVQSAIQDALNNETLVFAAASNNGTQKATTFPAWLEGVICVNSANSNGVESEFNPEIKGSNNFSILGENVKSAWITEANKDPYKRMSGTSVATPIAAGVAALVLEYALQNEPNSFMKDLEFLKYYNGMTEVFDAMKRVKNDYRNVVPWEILRATFPRQTVSALIEKALWQFREN